MLGQFLFHLASAQDVHLVHVRRPTTLRSIGDWRPVFRDMIAVDEAPDRTGARPWTAGIARELHALREVSSEARCRTCRALRDARGSNRRGAEAGRDPGRVPHDGPAPARRAAPLPCPGSSWTTTRARRSGGRSHLRQGGAASIRALRARGGDPRRCRRDVHAEDRRLVMNTYGADTPVADIRPGFDLPNRRVAAGRSERPPRILFVGRSRTSSESDGARWLVEEIFPFVRGDTRNAFWTSSGRDLPDSSARPWPGINLLGAQPDLERVIDPPRSS